MLLFIDMIFIDVEWMISAMKFSDDFVMSQNKMVALVWGLCTGNHWERWWFAMIAVIELKRG